MLIKLVTPYLCTGKTHSHANDDGEGLRDGEYLAQMVLGDTLGEDGESRRALVTTQARESQSEVHVPALSGEGEHQLVLDPADASHDGDDAVVDLQIVTQERHHHEPLQSNVKTLERGNITTCHVS